MRVWLPCAGFVVAGAGLGLPALVYGCAGQSYGSCTDTGTCVGDASMGGDSPVGSEGGVQHDGGSSGGDSATDGHPGDGPGISCDAAAAIVCSGSCVDKETDPANCGTCGHACSGPEGGTGSGVCVNAACEVACEPEAGTTLLCPSGDCVDPTTTTNCGTCGNACPGPEAGPGHPVCQPGGMCALACDSDGGATEILCSGSCVSPDDVNHCGTCTPCAQPPSGHGAPTCPAAQCVMTCLTGYHPGGASCNADCLVNTDDPSGDPCVVADGLGMFVSPTGSDSSGDGSKEHPFATIGHAMDTAETADKRVYACGALTGELLVVGASRDGVNVYGGFDCTTWAYNASTKTKLAPTLPGFALQVNGLTTGVTFEDFEFDSIAATTAGGSSQAVLVNASQNVTFRRVAITAGSASVTAASGAAGTDTWSGVGTTGNSASTSSPSLGGLTQSNCTCGGSGGEGGNAGTWNSTTFTVIGPGANGVAGTVGALSDEGVGAHQPAGGAIVACTPGTAGAAGVPGTGGAGGTAPGTITATGWSNPGGLGADGQPGGVAQGGGGGGGGLYDPAVSPNGLGGSAGGGCGGCGGAGAASGGSPGGSSIALVVVSSSVTIDTCTLSAAAGGAGGQGGAGAPGQSGGPPGTPATSGCNGGSGGTGGTGGAGGGGAGGHSIAIAYHGTAAPTQVGTVTTNVSPTRAAGGAAGNGIAGTPSADGLSIAVQAF